jgi:pyruvate,water dikinase
MSSGRPSSEAILVQRRMTMTRWVRQFDEIGMDDVPIVGGKNASLGEMRRGLTRLGIRTPDGFATTADAYRAFLDAAGLGSTIADALGGLDINDLERLQAAGARVRAAILAAGLPPELAGAVTEAYRRLEAEYGANCDVAVRSSATAEDLPDASFAGQQETFLNIHGAAMLLDAVRRCFASLFTDRAIVYRVHHGFDHVQVALSVGVQKMVRSDLASAGVMFSIDTETGFANAVLISGAYGLGESVVQGTVNPDEFYVFKPTLVTGFRPILQKKLGTKEFKLVYEEGGTRQTRSVPVPPEDRERFVLADEDILTLGRWAVLVEEHYSALRGRPTPMDIEWAKDGRTGELFLVQARPETVHARRDALVLERFRLEARGEILAKGRSVGEKIGQGPARVIRSAADLEQLQQGETLVTEMTDPDWEPVMRRAAAVVTDRGGRTCHAAIVSRELGIPAVVGTDEGTSLIPDGAEVTVSCAEGEDGRIYRGLLASHVETTDLAALRRPRTAIMLNVGNPAEAFSHSFLPNDGVGLARLEFIISSHVRAHPMALLHPERIRNLKVREQIERLSGDSEDRGAYFVERLAEGVATIAAAFYPKDVIVRLSDFKSNEYAGLPGGADFEPTEENPMLGFRGASRYYDERYREGFALECRAIRKVRETMGLRNVKLMVPFCRTVKEGERVIRELAANGLVQGEHELELYVMCEIPSNVILASEFAKIFDGFSIGSNDLTQLILGVDRDSSLVAPLFDERDEAVKAMIAQVIATAHTAGRKIGICGQAPSDYPEFARFLVDQGIDSISLNADAVLSTTVAILEIEAGSQAREDEDAAHISGRDRYGDGVEVPHPVGGPDGAGGLRAVPGTEAASAAKP